jgi:hypothetical protein
MTALVEQQPMPRGETRMHSVLFPNKMTHSQALVIDKFGDGLKNIEPLDLSKSPALQGTINSLTDMTGGRKSGKHSGLSSTSSSTMFTSMAPTMEESLKLNLPPSR